MEVRALEAGAGGRNGKTGASRMAMGVEDAGLYRLRTASEAAWPQQVAFRKQESFWQKLGGSLTAVGRLVVPVLLLVSALAGTYLYLDTKLPYFADNGVAWLTLGHAILPAAFFAIALTNRRYGSSYAFAQLAVSMLAIVVAIAVAADSLRGLVPAHAVPSMRFATAFGGAFFVSSFVSILMFEGARGPRWWTAPLVGLATGAIAFSAIFFPAAFAGTPDPLWVGHLFVFMGLMFGSAFVALVPYWLLRSMVPPLSGLGGY
jgi:uncharacterized PurR-regulated membrane protein YhhQ (DUF165 family)